MVTFGPPNSNIGAPLSIINYMEKVCRQDKIILTKASMKKVRRLMADSDGKTVLTSSNTKAHLIIKEISKEKVCACYI
jgi:hypothetical protein